MKEKFIIFGQNLFDLAAQKKFHWNNFCIDFPRNSEKSVGKSLKPRFLTLQAGENIFWFWGYGLCQIGNPIFESHFLLVGYVISHHFAPFRFFFHILTKTLMSHFGDFRPLS